MWFSLPITNNCIIQAGYLGQNLTGSRKRIWKCQIVAQPASLKTKSATADAKKTRTSLAFLPVAKHKTSLTVFIQVLHLTEMEIFKTK